MKSSNLLILNIILILISCSKDSSQSDYSKKLVTGLYKPIEYTGYRYEWDENKQLKSVPQNIKKVDGSLVINPDYTFIFKFTLDGYKEEDLVGKFDINGNSIIDNKNNLNKYYYISNSLIIENYVKGPLYGDRDNLTGDKELLVYKVRLQKI